MSKTSVRGGSWQEMFTDQPDKTFSQASPVQNTWYTVFEKNNCAIRASEFAVATIGEDLEVKMTIDGGTARTAAASAAATVKYHLTRYEGAVRLTSASPEAYRGEFHWQGKHIKIEMRKTSANSTGTLSARIKWAKK